MCTNSCERRQEGFRSVFDADATNGIEGDKMESEDMQGRSRRGSAVGATGTQQRNWKEHIED
jgi:hypothetical protein